MQVMTALLPLIVAIVGPTAVGKTALSLDLAAQLSAEIVSADSRLIYQGMDIGTAKPTLAERAQVPHHLIDIVPPDADYSLAMYQTAAYATIEAILARGRVPLIVGGTGQYVAALLEGWQIPRVAPDEAVRAQLQADADVHGPEWLHQQLQHVDPAAARAIDSRNVRRVIRALEVWRITGQPISLLQQRQTPPYRMLTLHLDRERDDLYQRIDARVEAMIHAGLIAEVFGLVAAGYPWQLPSMSSLGYAEFAALWHGRSPAHACITQLKFNTHRFARKQNSWFRRLPGHHLLDAAASDLLDQAMAAVQAYARRASPHTDQ